MLMLLPLLLAATPTQQAPLPDERVVCEPKRDAFGRKSGKQACLTVAEWKDYVRLAERDGRVGPARDVPFALQTVPTGYYSNPSSSRSH